jgi:hypothetical protein
MRTSQEIVDQTNKLARRFAKLDGWDAPNGCRFWETDGFGYKTARKNRYWEMACIAQEELTGTDAENALAKLESSEEVK